MSLKTLPATAPLEEILQAIREDGGLILSDFVDAEFLAELNKASEPVFARAAEKLRKRKAGLDRGDGKQFLPQSTIPAHALFKYMPEQMTKWVRMPLWKAIMAAFLDDEVTVWSGDKQVTMRSTYNISIAMAFETRSGAEDQILHRDQTIHAVRGKAGTTYTTQVGCMIAGLDSTARNGATKIIPGSHLWDNKRQPHPEDTISGVMKAGSAMFWLGSTYHGAGANTTKPEDPDHVRRLFGIFATRDMLRTSENWALMLTPEEVKKLPQDVLQLLGFYKSLGGAGYIEGNHPYDVLYG